MTKKIGFYLFIILGVYLLSDLRLSYDNSVPTGDEPHYLLIVQSLVQDGDLNVSDNYFGEDWKEYFHYPRLNTHYAEYSDKYSVHNFGLPLLLVLPYILGGYPGCMFFMSLATVLLLFLCWKLAETINGSPLPHPAWILFPAFSSPIWTFSSQIYPEIIAAIILVWGVYLILTPFHPKRFLLYLPALLFLPYLHIKYFLPLAILCVFLFFELPKWKWRAILIGWLGIIYGSVRICNYLLYGDSRVTAAYTITYQNKMEIYLDIKRVILAYLFDPQMGLFFQSPIYLLVPFGIYLLWKKNPDYSLRKKWLFPIFFLIYLGHISIQPIWIFGWSTAFRHLVPTIPFWIIPLLLVLNETSSRLGKKGKIILGGLGIFWGLLLIIIPITRYILVETVCSWFKISLTNFPRYWNNYDTWGDPEHLAKLPSTHYYLLGVFLLLILLLNYYYIHNHKSISGS